MTLNVTTPTVGGDSGTWGTELNTAITAIVTYVNALEAGEQPADSDLAAIAALTTTAFGRSLLTLADAAAARSALALGSAATSATSAFDAAGAAAAAQAASQPLDSDLTAIAALTTTAFGRSFLALVDAPAARTLLGLGDVATHAASEFATAAQLGNYAPLASPAFTGSPTVNGSPIGSGGGLPSTIVAKTSAYTAAAGDFVEATTTASFTVTLPAAPAVGALVAVKKVSSDSNTLTIAPSGGGTIDGDANATTTTQWAGAIFEHKGSNVWRVAASMTTTGPQGPAGATGAAGPTGATGTTGPSGNTVLNGAGAPSSGTGVNGDFYLDTAATVLYGPKAGGAWPGTGQTLIGSGGGGFLGDGSDGSVTFDGTTAVAGFSRSGTTYTATRNAYSTGVTVNSGVTVFMAGYILHCTGTVTNNGTIHNNGLDANVNIGGAAQASAVLAGGGAGVNANTTNGSAGGAVTIALGGAGGAGGVGTGGTAGAAGGVSGPGANQDTSRTQWSSTTGSMWGGTGVQRIAGGSGGGAGGGNGAAGSGGGSGAGGGVLVVNARGLVNNGAIRARGGAGGTAATSGAAGGGAGGGGVVFINTLTAVSGTGTVDASGGTGGTGANSNGNNGNAGIVRQTVWS